MVNTLRKIFEKNPGKSVVELKDSCSDCGREVIISITRTSGGFGVLGGALFKSEAESIFVKCPDCCKLKPGKTKDDGRTEDG